MDNLEKAIDGSYWAESNGDRKGRPQIDGFDTLRTSFYIDSIPYYADIKVKVVDKGAGQNSQNVAYYIEPEEITSIKKMDTSSPTGGRHAPNIFFRDGVSISDISVPQSGTGVNTQGMQNGGEYAAEAQTPLRMPQLVDEQGRTYDERVLALESIGKEEPSSSATANTEQSPPLGHPSSSSFIRVQDLLCLVNSEYQKCVPKMANAEMNTVGAFTNNSQSLGGSAPAISSAFGISIPTFGGNVNAAQELSRGVADTRSLADTTSATSGTSIPTSGGNVNGEKYSTGRGLDKLADTENAEKDSIRDRLHHMTVYQDGRVEVALRLLPAKWTYVLDGLEKYRAKIGAHNASSVPTKETKKPQIAESVVPQGFQGLENAENANVRKAGWLCSFDMDYRHRGISKHYRVDVMAALPEGGGAE